jgi:septal ring factor EnvC (AmiA/AmiB activator)
MAETNMKPTDLELKIKKLITLHVSLKTQIESLKADNQKLTDNINQQQEEIRKLGEESQLLRLARSVNSGSESHDKPEMKAKLNELIRDIDKCLALLNH